MSDLHFEFNVAVPGWMPPLPEQSDVLVLAGDISSGEHIVRDVMKIASALPETHIVFVAGNHEFYRENIDDKLEELKRIFADNSNIHFLENAAVEINGIHFLGCTLWSGFDTVPEYTVEQSMVTASQCINDFRQILTGKEHRRFLPMDAAQRFYESKTWLDQQLTVLDSRRTVVVTHFPPTREAHHQNIAEDIFANYFQANCLDIIEEHQPLAWLYGHNHYSRQDEIGQTILLSKQLGYPNERDIPPFNTDCAIVIPD